MVCILVGEEAKKISEEMMDGIRLRLGEHIHTMTMSGSFTNIMQVKRYFLQRLFAMPIENEGVSKVLQS